MRFLCPECRHLLEEKDRCLVCHCGKIFPIIEGIPNFSELDSFYEGAWKQSHMRGRASLGNFFYTHFSKDTHPTRQRFISKCLKNHTSCNTQFILDLGCGGGNDIFSKQGVAVGIDVSLTSLKNAKAIYHKCVQADIRKPLPFEDETFDFISSTEVLEHIPLPDKDNLMQEIHRILRKGGKAVFIFETTGFFHRLAKLKSAYYYKKNFVTKFSHQGLETSEQAIERIRDKGFKVLKIEKHFSIFFPIGMLLEYLDNEFKQESFLLDKLSAAVKFISKYQCLAEIVNFCAGSLQEILEAFLPVDAGSTLCVLCKKE